MTRASLLFLASALFALTGCASQALLTVRSQPEGAFITENGTGTSYGAAPVAVVYNKAALRPHADSNGCYLVKGFQAHWVSGVVSQLPLVRLCGSATGNYTIQFNRDPSAPGLDKDLQFALQIQTLRAQQQQAQAAQDAADAALFNAWAAPQSVFCTTQQIGSAAYVHCQ